MHVPFVNLGAQFVPLENQFVDALKRVGRTGGYILGDEVETFESALARACGTRHAVTVANGTDALILVLKAWGIGPGDEVITVPNSFIATAGAIVAVGAHPVFVDVAEDFNIDAKKIEAAITPATKAIIPVHLTGNPADMNAINEIAGSAGIKVLEDAAQAIGAKYKGKLVGSLGDAAAFSLHPLKNLHLMGDGGFVSTDDSQLYELLIQLRNHGLVDRNESARWGLNSRLDAMQAAFGNIKLGYLQEWTRRFREIAQLYQKHLTSTVQCPIINTGNEAVFHNFVIRVPDRAQFMAFLAEKGIETKIHYPVPLHLMKCSAELGYRHGDFPVTECQSEQIVSLPIYPELTDEQIEYVCIQVQQYYRGDDGKRN